MFDRITDSEYHLLRARAERDVAYRSADARAADAHMELSALHLKQALLLEEVRRSPVGNVRPFQPALAGAKASIVPQPVLEQPPCAEAIGAT